jgi:hypothetical protein
VADSETKAVVKEGVTQAASYRAERKAKASALCCFDMRKGFSGVDCFKGVNALARREKVRLCVWHLFHTSKEYRDALAT